MVPRHSLHRSVFVIGIVTLFLSLMAPALSLQAAALQEDAPRCEDGFVVNEETGGCDPVEQTSPITPRRIDPSLVQQPTEPPDCEDGFIFSPDAGGCVPEPNAETTQAPPECEDGFVFNEQTGGCDRVPVTEEPTRVVTEPTQEPVDPTQVTEPTREPEPTVVEESREPDDGSATVNITAHLCSAESELDPKSASAEELAKQCAKPLAGVGLELLSNGEPYTRAETGEDGQLHMPDFPSGELTVIQHTPEGYVFGAWVTTLYPDGQDGEGLPPAIGLEPDPSHSYLNPDIVADIGIYYFWDEISVTVETYWCELPPTNGHLQSVQDLVPACMVTGPGSTLSLIGDGLLDGDLRAVAGTPGAVTTWIGVSALTGPYELTETGVDDTVWTSEVRCREQGNTTPPPSSQFVVQPPTTTSTAHQIMINTQVGLDWECKWYHFSDNTLWVHNYICANAPTSTATLSDVKSTCNPSAGLNEGFTFTHPGGSEYKLTVVSQKSDGGLVVFRNFADGGVTLAKDPVPGHGGTLFYCDGTSWDGTTFTDHVDVQITPDNFGTVHMAFDTNSVYDQTTSHCSWFSLPGESQIPSDSTVAPEPTVPQTFVTVEAPFNAGTDDEEHPPDPIMPGTLVVTSLSCPEGMDFEVAEPDELSLACTEPASGVGVTVADDEETINRGVTGDDGTVQIGVPESEFSLIAQPLAEQQAMSLACASFPEWDQGAELPGFDIGEPVPEPWRLAAESGLIQCHLYLEFVPLDDGGREPGPTFPPTPTTGHVFLWVHNCSEYVTMTELTYSALQANVSCPVTVAGDEFTLTDSANTQTPGSVGDKSGTGNNPVTAWANIPEGQFTISQAPQTGYDSKVVWCHASSVDSLGGHHHTAGPTLIQIVNESFQLEVDLQHEYFECFWYNLPDNISIGQGPIDPSDEVPEAVVTIPVLVDDDLIPDTGPVEGVEHPPDPIMPGSLVLTAVRCTEDVQVADSAGDELAKSCTEPVPGIGFSISANGEPFRRGATNDAGSLKVGVPAGELMLEAHPPDPILEAALACASSPEWQSGDDLPAFKGAEPIPQPWSFEIESGLLQCQLYLGASAQGDAGASGSSIRAFRSQRESTPSPTATELVAVQSDPDLTVQQAELPTPTPTHGPVDPGDQVITANAYTPTPTPQRMVVDPTATSSLQVGERGPVAISTVPSIKPIDPSDDEGSGLVITTLACPEGLELEPGAWTPVELMRRCRDRMPGFGYELLANGELIDRGATDERGQLHFDRVPDSDVELVPLPFRDYQGGLLSCVASPERDEFEDLQPTSLHSGHPSWELTWAPWVRECYTFVPYAFFPRIEVQTFWCPALDPFPQDVNGAEAACQQSGPGAITFLLADSGNIGAATQPHTPTGAPGASFGWGPLSTLDNPHTVVELGIGEIGMESIVWCRENSMLTGPTPYQFSVPTTTKTDAVLELEAHYARTWECKWFHYDPAALSEGFEHAGSNAPIAARPGRLNM